MKLPIHCKYPPMIVSACLAVLALTVYNLFGFLTPQFQNRPKFLPQSSVVCEGRIARMSEQRLKGTRLWVDDLFCQDGDVMRAVPGMAQLTVMGGTSVALYGDVVRFRSNFHTPHRYYNPGAIDWERKAASDGVSWTGAIQSPEWVMVVNPGGGSPLRVIDGWRQKLARHIDSMSDPNLRGTTAALLLGNAGLLPETFGDGLRYLGIIHLYVISGLHVAVVAWAVYHILYWLLVRRRRWALERALWRWSAAGSLVAVWVYVGLVGGGVSVVRSGIMVSAYLAALILDRHPHVGTAIALAALLLIVQSPHVIFVPGFQLSFVAVIALVVIYPILFNKLRLEKIQLRVLRWCAEGLIAAVVATWATAPIVAYHFHQTPLLGIPANLIAGPYTTIILMPIGFVWTLLAGIPCVSEILQTIWTYAAIPLVRAIEWATPLAESTQWTFTPNVAEMMWWYLPALLTLSLLPKKSGGIVWSLIGLSFVVIHAYHYYCPHPLQVTFLDVGQGASVLVEFPNRHTMLIDGGGAANSDFDLGRWVVAPALLSRGITQVDDLVLTHPHPDHYGGLAYVAEHFHPKHFFTNASAGEDDDERWQAFTDRMRAAGLSPESLNREMRQQVGEVELIWRHPSASGPDETQGKNNGSLVTEIRYGDFSALIVGDIQSEAEAEILRNTDVGAVSVLQVPHHTSETSSTVEFLRRVMPQVAIAQLGFENRYGFPRVVTVQRYNDFGIPLCRTDQDGAVTITADSPTTQFSIQTDRSSETCIARAR